MIKNNKKFFNTGAELFYKLFKAGQTLVSKFITKYKVENLIKEAADFDLLNTQIDLDFYEENIKKSNFGPSLVFLIKLDLLSASDAGLIEYIRENRMFNKNLSDSDAVYIYPSYNSIDHFYKGYDKFQTLFKNLVFIVVDIFGNTEFSFKNYYIDDVVADGRLNVVYLPYPVNDSITSRLSDGFCAEKEQLDKSDKVYLSRLNCVLSKLDLSVPIMFISSEMVGSRFLDLKIKEIISNNRNIVAYLCPSYHTIINKTKRNISTIYLIEEFTLKQIQNFKFFPIENETIVGDCAYINLIHIKGFGKVLTLICRDFLTDLYLKLIEMIIPDVIIVQCYTTHWREFINRINKIVELNNCVIACNSCSAFSEKEKEKSVQIIGYRERYDSQSPVCIKRAKSVCDDCKKSCDENEKCNTVTELIIETYENDAHRPYQYIEADIKEDV